MAVDYFFECIYDVITFFLLIKVISCGAVIRTQLVKIGNSQGICIPKLLLKQSGIRTEVEIEVHGDRTLLKSK